ncbi:MAG: sensor histidine kinase, partial [Chitinophagaceae bacterium]
SQQRIYAMSLIHQKIYQSEDIKTIEMNNYLPELIQYLEDSFGNNKRIHFQVEVDPMQLDISQAIPVALIINESVTNSIKYAFPDNRKGVIEIRMHRIADQVSLEITDNGVGIDDRWLINDQADSLGLELIRGLSRDLKARLKMENDNGTRITLVFNITSYDTNDETLSRFLISQLSDR